MCGIVSKEKIMEYNDVTAFINKAKKFGSRLDLTRIRKLCELLDNPHDKCKFVHIAGTNGKGSVSIFTENILMQAGYKTGLYTSPFIYRFNERIQINNIPISDKRLTHVMGKVVAATEQMLKEEFEHPTEFELITAAAFLYFAEEKCDVVVMEVGLGGKLDSTNVIASPLVSVITSISYDHMDYLGNTLTAIAQNKCGIIKRGCPVVSYPFQNEEVTNVIRNTAAALECSLLIADINTLKVKETSLNGNVFCYRDVQYETSLIGEYQIYNAITALNVAESLKKQGYIISCANMQNGLKAAKWPARFEILNKAPLVIADGSHNEKGMSAFVETANKMLDGKRIICVFGMLRDKEYLKCLSLLSQISDTVIVTEVDSPRAETVEKLEMSAKAFFPEVYAKADNAAAVSEAKRIAKKDDAIVALGSLYMMKNIKTAVEKIFTENG